MNLSTARTQLRLMLGDQSESVWSDSDLNTLLNRANLRIYRRLLSEDPSSAFEQKDYTYAANSESIAIVGSGVDSSSAAVNPIINLEKAFYKTSGSTTFRQLPIGTMAEFNEVKAGTSTTHDLISVLPNLYGGYVGYLVDGKGRFGVRPVPSTALTIRLVLNCDVGEAALSGDSSNLLSIDASSADGQNLAYHEAVVYDAGFLATFKDESLRQEFMSMREDVMSIQSMRATSLHEAY